MYFRMDIGGEDSAYLFDVSKHRDVWISGRSVPLDAIATPLRYVAVDSDEGSWPILNYDDTKSLMSKRLVEVLRSAGVDNLQIFDAEIMRVPEDFEWHYYGGEFPPEAYGDVITDWVVVNVVGLVSCADVEASETTPLADVQYFHNLVINPEKTGGLKMFRLAEFSGDVIVAEEVAKAIYEAGFDDVALEPLEEKVS